MNYLFIALALVFGIAAVTGFALAASATFPIGAAPAILSWRSGKPADRDRMQ